MSAVVQAPAAGADRAIATSSFSSADPSAGWDGSWQLDDGYRVVDGSLPWPDLATGGGHLVGGRGLRTARRTLDVRPDGAFAPWTARGEIGAPGTTLWLSCLMRRDRGMPQGSALLLRGDTGWGFDEDWLALGCFPRSFRSNDGRWGLAALWSSRLSTDGVALGETALLVLRLDFGVFTTATLYVDPAELGGAAPATPSAKMIVPRPAHLRRLAWYAGPSHDEASLGEIRVGPTYASVTPTRNQPPSFVAGGDVTVGDDAGHVAVPGWASAISPGAPEESGQHVSFLVSVDRPELFAEQPAVAADGTLTFAPALGASGAAQLTVVARDDGGGNDTSAPANATITIVSMAPVILGAPSAVLEADGIHVDLAVVAGPAARAAGFSYAWADSDAPAASAVTLAGGASAGCAVATVSAAGTYVFRVTIGDAYGRSAAGKVSIQVAAVASSLRVAPAAAHFAVGDSRAFSAAICDQFGGVLDAAPPVAWSVDGGGVIDGGGSFTANALGTPFTVTASAGGLVGTATIGVFPLVDVAQNQPATQSSTYPFADGPAWHAVDGNTDGNFWDDSVTCTNSELHAHWDVDLGASFALRQVRVWNRSDQVWDRLSDWWVFTSDQPFASDDPAVEAQTPGVTSFFQHASGGWPTTVTVSADARYVRVQLDGTNYLSLAEVQVMALDDGTLRGVGALAPRGPGALGGDETRALAARRPRLRAA